VFLSVIIRTILSSEYVVEGLPVFGIALIGLAVNIVNSWWLDGNRFWDLVFPQGRTVKQRAMRALKNIVSLFRFNKHMDITMKAAKLHFP